MKFGIVLPTYNEATNIEATLQAIYDHLVDLPKKHSIEVLVVDDSSPDGTAALAKTSSKQLNTARFKINVEIRAIKDGLGGAYMHGFDKLIDRCDFILQMDADLSHNPVYIPAFINAAANGHDLIVGTRYIKGGDTPDWSLSRKMLSKYGNLYTRIFLGSKLTDYTGGFNMYGADLLRAIDYNSLASKGYGFQIELKYRALSNATSPFEIPIVFMDRVHGTSKIPKSTLYRNSLLVIKLRMSK